MKSLNGEIFGNWTVIGDYVTDTNRERRWLCHCICGTERYVLERSLLHGGSKSCGCQRKEKAAAAVAYNLSGQAFGDLVALRIAEKPSKTKGIWWHCRCSCGNECDVLATQLVTGRKTSCGCKSRKNYAVVDITGIRFRHLTALYPTDRRSKKGSVIWHCRCDCGNEVDVSHNDLLYSNIKSCGCQKKEHDQLLQSFLSHVCGTSIEMLKSKKVPSNNTTGYKGVYLVNGKYSAKIVFQKKQYHLGKYDTLEKAVQVRNKAEEELFDKVVEFYESWKQQADTDPAWGTENPFSISVCRVNDEFKVETVSLR